jgi:stage II sporulation protein P
MPMRRNASVRRLRAKRAAIALLVLAALLFSFVKSCGAPAQDEGGIYVTLDAGDAQGEDAQTSDMLLGWIGQTILTPQLLMSAGMPVLSGIPTDATASWQGEAAMEAMAGIDHEDIDPEVGDDIKIELTNLDPGDYTIPKLAGSGPQILIYHTHTCEAYTQTASDAYVATGSWRTNDQSKSVVRVGDALATELRKCGFNVIHDRTDHEPPKLGTAYERSLVTMQAYKKKYPNLNIFIDLHRDAYSSKNGSDVVTVDGKSVARLMLVVGTGEGKTGNGFKQRPNWKANYQLAKLITDQLNKTNPRLARPVCVKTGRYNQHVSDSCMLIEVGHNESTLAEALNAVPYLAKTLSDALKRG